MSDPIVKTVRRVLAAGTACGLLLATAGLASAQQAPSPTTTAPQPSYHVLDSHVAWTPPPATVTCPELPDPQPGQSGWHLFRNHVQWYGACARPLPAASSGGN
jgi:hypothetical protein